MTSAMHILALSDGVTIGMWTINAIITVAMGFALYRLNLTARRFERLEDLRRTEMKELRDARDADVHEIEEKLHGTNVKLIDERFRALTHELRGNMQGFVTAVNEMKERMKEGSGTFNALGERDHQIELKMLDAMTKLRDYVRDNAATKGDVQRHQDAMEKKIEQINRHLGEQDKTIAVLVKGTGHGL